MIEQNEIDQLFEEQLGGLSVEPSASSWEAISSSLDAAAGGSAMEKKGRIYLYALIGTVAAILAYVLFFNQGKSRNIKTKERPIATFIKNDVENSSTKSIAHSNKTDLKENTKTNKRVNQESTLPVEHISKKLNDKNSEIENKDKDLKHLNFDENINGANQNNQANRVEMAYSKPVVGGTVLAKEKPFIEESVESSDNQVETDTKLDKVSLLTENQANVNNLEELPLAEKNVVENSTNEAILEAKSTEEVVETNINEEPIIEGKPKTEDSKLIDRAKAVVDEIESVPSAPQLAGTHLATGLSFDFIVGPAIIQTNDNYSPSEGALVYRTSAENHIISPVLGLNIKYHINNWFIQSGVGYAEYGENSIFNKDVEMHDTNGYAKKNIDQYYTYDTTGWTTAPSNPNVLIPVYDAVYHSDTSYQWVTKDSLYMEHLEIYAKNRFRYIEIPAMVGYGFRFKNLTLELSTGVSFGFRVNSSGKFFDSQNNLVDINPSNSPYSNTMMNYILSIGLKYHITNRLSLIAQPNYKTNLNSIIKSGIGSDVRYSSYSVNLGINYIIK